MAAWFRQRGFLWPFRVHSPQHIATRQAFSPLSKSLICARSAHIVMCEGDVKSGDSSDPFFIVNMPRWVSTKEGGWAHEDIKRSYSLLYSTGIFSFTHTHTHTHCSRNVQSQNLGLEVNFWPLGSQPHPDNAVLLACLAEPRLSSTPISAFTYIHITLIRCHSSFCSIKMSLNPELTNEIMTSTSFLHLETAVGIHAHSV